MGTPTPSIVIPSRPSQLVACGLDRPMSPGSPMEEYRVFTMSGNGPGCIFEHLGHIPEAVYSTDDEKTGQRRSPLEDAVINGDAAMLRKLHEGGEEVSVRLKVGEMSCLEYAAMTGACDVLRALLDCSVNACILQEYFQLDDIVERAYMLSTHKQQFLAQEALAEANRLEAALFTAVAYNRPACVALLLCRLGTAVTQRKHLFRLADVALHTLSAAELAQAKGHIECYTVIQNTMCEQSK